MSDPAPSPQAPPGPRLLTINAGSSSLKFALFDRSGPPRRLVSGKVERIGLAGARLVVVEGDRKDERAVEAPDQSAALGRVFDAGRADLAAIGHRVVFGGPRFAAPERITPEVLDALKRLAPLDPEHLPGELALIEVCARMAPGVPQVACFDTAFHHEMPAVAQRVPIPRRFAAEGVRRYGFHGLSYAYLMEELARLDGPDVARGRVVLAHLGSGASLAAVRDGRCVDTTMVFTPSSGIVMGTRTGDLDPGLVLYLMTTKGLTVEQFQRLVNRESGLLGVSETSPDVRDLLAREADDPRAAEAVALFCYRARAAVGALAASLGGLETLVFAGGIGENSPTIRARIADGLGFLGLALDPARNDRGADANAGLISTDDARVRVRVIRTDEEIMIARAAAALVSG